MGMRHGDALHYGIHSMRVSIAVEAGVEGILMMMTMNGLQKS
jgi:hypothetical protein